ncbi:MAG: hypothetical protein ACI89L_001726 [Phycisphaerales bacterium]|jgi:hypothetical protein
MPLQQPNNSLQEAPLPIPLSDSEQKRAVRVASRMHAELGRLVGELPEPIRRASPMSRRLKVVRNTCQRVVATLSDTEPSLETLTKLPGIKGLELLIEAMYRYGLTRSHLESTTTAVREFGALIGDLAGSHTKLIARLAAGSADTDNDGIGGLQSRIELVAAATRITGRHTRFNPTLYAFRADENDPKILHRAMVQAMIGTTVVPGGMPAMLESGLTTESMHATKEGFQELNHEPAIGSSVSALLQDFTSRPLPTVTTQPVGDRISRIIDPTSLSGPVTFDVASANRTVHHTHDPKTGKPTLSEVWTLINAPTKRMVLDIFLHRDLHDRLTTSADALVWRPDLDHPAQSRWMYTVPVQPTITDLGRGLGRVACEHYDRMPELAESFFDLLGWDANDFYGLRLDVEYPVWRAGYCVRFEERR